MDGGRQADADIGNKPSFGDHEEAMQAYMRDGEARAMALGNRGPIRFNPDGTLHKDILEAYSRCGFYIFEGVLGRDELDDIEADFWDIQDRLPTGPDAATDAKGRPALGSEQTAKCLYWAKALSDPWGGTTLGNGRHQVEMVEPNRAADTPEHAVFLMVGSLQFSEAALRCYAHPQLLRVAEQINGPDFVPFNEGFFMKAPYMGASVSWHQDGQTHWDAPDWDEGTHGFNFMAQLFGCTAANGLWVVPGSHKLGKADIRAMQAPGEADRIPGAVPLICAPGDVAINSRQLVHGSFANTSPDWRVTVNFGFHRRRSVIGVKTASFHNADIIYDDALVHRRSRVIGYAINARKQRFPDETPFTYQPFGDTIDDYVWDEAAKKDIVDYNLVDLFI